MIIKFDHVAYTCKTGEEERVIRGMEGYYIVFKEEYVPNIEIKKSLMLDWQKYHSITLLKHENHLPIEITAYDNVKNETNHYQLKDNQIIVYSKNIRESQQFYEKIGFKNIDGGMMEIKPVIDKNPLQIMIKMIDKGYVGDKVNSLDQKGLCCLAFVTNNIDKERIQLAEKNVQTTVGMRLALNGKNIRIFFAYNSCGDICEFMEVK